MKKNLRNILTTAGVLLSVSAPVCSAQQTTVAAPASLMPKTVDLVFRLDTSVKNPIGMFTDLLAESLSQDSFPGGEDGKTLIKSLLTGNSITLGVDMPPADKQEDGPDFYIFTKIDSANLDRLLKIDGTEAVKSTYSGIDTYTQESAYIGYTEGNIFVTNKEETLKATIDRLVKPDGNALSDDDNYIRATSHLIKDSFLDFYQAPGALTAPVTEEISPMFGTFMNDIMEAQQAGSGSLAQTDKGFEYSFYAKSDKDALEKLGINLNDFNFSPGLYKRISGSGLLFYTENNDMNSALKNTEKMFETSADEPASWKTGFKDETGIDFDSEILDNMQGRYAFVVTATSQIYPALTMMFETKDGIKTVLAKFAGYIDKKLRTETPGDNNDYYTYEIKNIDGTYFYSFKIDLSKTDESMSELPEASRTLYLNMSVTEGNVLLISTHPDLENFYRKTTNGIMDSSAVSDVFTNHSETVSGISYMGMTELQKYANTLMTYMKTPIELKSPAVKLMAAWESFFNKNYATDEETWTTGKIDVDTSMFANYPKLIEQIASYLETANNEQMEAFQAEMALHGIKDLEKDAWYYGYIKSLAGKGIISGYEDGTFRPDAPITRAEYTKMIIMASEKLKLIKDENSSFSPMFEISIGRPQYDTEKIFGDVATDSWYYPYVKQAKSNGIVKGYDGTNQLGDFRPDSFITRAEAVKILFNISGRLKGIQVIAQPMDSLVHFNDVSKDDWFLTPIAAAFHYGLVKGATPQTFEPARNITRAEAAKIIKLFMDMETVKK